MPVTPRQSPRYPSPGGTSRASKLFSSVTVFRTMAAGEKSFEVCMDIGRYLGSSRSIKRASGFTTACAFGKNPRVALSRALAKASRKMAQRGGAFARYGR